MFGRQLSAFVTCAPRQTYNIHTIPIHWFRLPKQRKKSGVQYADNYLVDKVHK